MKKYPASLIKKETLPNTFVSVSYKQGHPPDLDLSLPSNPRPPSNSADLPNDTLMVKGSSPEPSAVLLVTSLHSFSLRNSFPVFFFSLTFMPLTFLKIIGHLFCSTFLSLDLFGIF